MSKTMILVAEGSRAKLYLSESPKQPWQEIEDLIEPEGRMQEKDLGADQPGRFGGMAGEGRHALDEKHGLVEVAQKAFSKELCEEVERRHRGGEFDQLVVVAAPAFLGMLRKAMGSELSKIVVEEIDKNLVHHRAEDVRGHLSTPC